MTYIEKELRNVSNINKAIVDRFWEKVNLIDDFDSCWTWTAAKNKKTGYGVFGIGQGKTMSAHKVAWLIAKSSTIPDDLLVTHRCGNRICVRPCHLHLDTQLGNIHEAVLSGTMAAGENHYNHKLTNDQVTVIRGMLKLSSMPIKDIAALFGVSYQSVWYIGKGKKWKQLVA